MASNTGNTILALLTGAAIGAGIGILFAPDKGTNTRRKIREGVDEAKENLNEKFSEVSEKLVELNFKLEEAISTQNFEKAIELRDTIKKLEIK